MAQDSRTRHISAKRTLRAPVLGGAIALLLLIGGGIYLQGVAYCERQLASGQAPLLLHEYIATTLLLLGGALAIFLLGRYGAWGKLSPPGAGAVNAVQADFAEGERIFDSVFAKSDTAFVLLDEASGTVFKANPAALAICGVERTEEVNPDSFRPLPPDHPLQRHWRTPLTSISSESRVAYLEKERFFIGDSTDLQCVALRDVTQAVLLQCEDRNHLDLLQNVMEQLPVWICIKDSDLRLIRANAAFDELIGDSDAALGHVRHSEWLGPVMDELLERDHQALASDVPILFDITATFPDGLERTFMTAKKRFAGQDGRTYILTTGTEITERMHMIAQLISLREKADEANKAKSLFLARMSHEIRTPMNAILGMSHLALNADPSERQRNYLGKIQGAAKNLLGIINDILDFSKIEAGEMKLETTPFDLRDVLADIDNQMQALLVEKPVGFYLDAQDLQETYLGDPLRIRQVLLNLANNAIKFTETGDVRLTCRRVYDHGPCCDVYFAVRDTGIGIPEESMERLFNSFQQADGSTTRKYGGTGLGLAISQQFVTMMGGRLEVSSTLGEGSCFFFTLRLNKDLSSPGEEISPGVTAAWQRHEASPAQDHEADALVLPSARILVVEDNEINQEIIIELLEQYDLQVKVANDGLEAVRMIEKERFDLVLMDLQMPVMDGLEATKHIRTLPDAHARSVPIIALTANAMTEDRDLCTAAGMNDFLSKPIEVPELQEKLLQWLGKPKGQH